MKTKRLFMVVLLLLAGVTMQAQNENCPEGYTMKDTAMTSTGNDAMVPLGSVSGTYYYYSTCWTVYSLQELEELGITPGSQIKEIAFMPYTATTYTATNVTIYMKEVPIAAITAYTDTVTLGEMSSVYSAEEFTFDGDDWMTLDSPFTYTGSGHLMVAVRRFGAVPPSNYLFHCVGGKSVSTRKSQTASTWTKGLISYRPAMSFRVCKPTVDCEPPAISSCTSDGNNIHVTLNGAENGEYEVAITLANTSANPYNSLQSVTTTSNTAVLEAMEPWTLYNVYVRSICNGAYSPWSEPVQVRTHCGVQPVTYNVNISPSTTDSCWVRHNALVSTYWFYSDNDNYAYAVMPEFDMPLNRLHVNFVYTLNAGKSIVLGVMSNPYDTNTFVPYDTLTAVVSTNGQPYDIDCNRLAQGTEGRLAFRWTECNLRSVTVDTIFGCYQPTNPVVSDITTTSAHISWQSHSQIETGFMVRLGTNSDYSTYTTYSTDSNGIVLENLQPGINYWYCVLTTCGETTSTGVYGTFQTGCMPITELPYLMNNSMAGSYQNQPPYLEPPCWTHIPVYGYAYWVLPEIDTNVIRMDQLKLTLSLQYNNDAPNTMTVGVMDNANDFLTFTPFGSFNLNTGYYQQTGERVFYNYLRQGKHVALRAPLDGITGIYSIILEQEAAAPVGNIVLVSRTDNSLTVDWTEQGIATEWQVECGKWVIVNGEGSVDNNSLQTFTTTTKPFTIDGLEPNTLYLISVRAKNHNILSEAREMKFRTLPQEGMTFTSLQVGNPMTYGDFNHPVRRQEKYSWQQTIYPLSQYSTPGWIDTVWFYCVYPYGYAGLDTSLTLYLGHVDTTAARNGLDWVPMEELTQVYHRHVWYATTSGWLPIVLDTPFFYNGIDELAVVFSHSYPLTHSSGDKFSYSNADYGTSMWRGGETEDYASHPGNNAGVRELQLPTARFSMLINNCLTADNVAVAHAGNDTAVVSWHERGTATQWQVAYQRKTENGEWEALGDTVVNNDTVAVPGIVAEHVYRFSVRPICGVGDTGSYSGNIMLNLVTPPAPIVYDTFLIVGTPTSSFGYFGSTPIVCTYADWGFEEEIIYPATLLEDMTNGTIHGLQFFYRQPTDYYEETFTIKIEEVEDSYFSSNDWRHTDNAQLVWTGSVTIVDSLWTVIFDTPFEYHGGNLLINTATDGLTNGYHSLNSFTTFTTTSPSILYLTANAQHMLTGSKVSLSTLPVVRFLNIMDNVFCRRPQTVSIDSVWGHGAIARWSNVDGAESYEWALYRDQELVLSGTTTADSVEINGLVATTEYSFTLRSVCSAADSLYSTYTFPVSFETPCGTIRHIDLPYVEDFLDYTLGNPTPTINCWTLHGYDAAPYFCTLYPGNYISLNPANDNMGVFAVMPAFEHPEDLRVIFDFEGTPNTTLAIGTMTDPNDTNTFVPLHTIVSPGIPSWENVIFDLNNCSETLAHIAFRASSITIEFPYYNEGFAAIRNINVVLVPTCPPIDSIVVDNISAYDATLTIADTPTEDVTYRVTYGDSNIVVSNTQVLLSGLTGTTNYTVTVTKICADGSQLPPVSTTFHTLCGTNALPWSYGFEGLDANYYATAGSRFDAECWTVHNRRAVNEPFVCNTATTANPMPHGGSRALVTYCTGEPATVLVLPEFEGQPQQMLMGLWLYRGTNLNNNHFSTGVEVGVVSTPDDPSTFTPVTTCISSDVAAWRHFEVIFPNITEGRIAIRYIPSQEAPLYLDDITVEALPNCMPPSTVTITDLTDNSATVNVTDLPGANHYRINIGNDSVDFTGNSYTLTGLSADSDYSIRVRTICNDTSLTDAVTHTFHTPCVATSIPWGENFNDMPVAGSYTASPLTCWGHLGTGIVRVTDNHELQFYHLSTERPNIAILPNFEYEIANLEMTLELRCDDYIAMGHTNDPQFKIGYITNTADSTTFVTVATLTPEFCTTGNTHVLTPTTVTFAGAPAGARIALRHNEEMEWNTEWYVDNINVQLVSGCLMPSVVTFSDVTDNAAMVHIAAPYDPDHYKLYLSEEGTSTIIDSVEVNGDSHLFEGLSEATTYIVSAKTICDDGSLTDATTGTFTTACSIISNLPWSENFDGVTGGTSTISNVVSLTTAFPCWGFAGRGSANIMVVYGTSNNRLYLDQITPDRNSTACTPVLADNLGSIEMTFSAIPDFFGDEVGTLQVGYTTSPNDTNYFTPVANFEYTDFMEGYTPTAHTMAVVFDSLPSGARIAFRIVGSNSNWYIDDVEVHATQSPIGIEKTTATNLRIYPNPAHETIVIETATPARMNIIDQNGRTVMEKTLTTEHTTLNISALARGAYYVRVMTESDIQCKKVLVY